MNTVNLRVKSTSSVREIYQLFREHKTWHSPFRLVHTPDYYEFELKEDDPMISFLKLKYGT